MINKDTYKRLTKKGGYTKDLDLKQELGYSYIYTRLSELEDKIEEGTLVELPCKVGDTVYEVFKEHRPPFIQETIIEKIVITEKGFKLRLSRNSVYETAISSLDKTLFLSKAQAEAKLKELQEVEE